MTTLLTQIKNRYYSVDCGMGYVLRLSDGRFVLLDGGMCEPGEAVHVFELLSSQTTNESKPVIAAWFFSHPHDDHIGCFIDFCKSFASEIHIERVIYNFPTKERCPVSPDIPNFDAVLSTLKDTEITIAKRGQQFRFADCIFDVLLTQEDMDAPIPNLNDSSLILRTSVANHRVLWLGDCQELCANRLCELYEEEDLQCDILQVGHHGYGGGSHALHQAVNPETLLWPVPDFTYQWVKDWECNTFLMNSPKITRCFLSGREEVTLDLSQPFPDAFKESATPRGTVVYQEDFSKTDLFRLGFCCITGASVPYKPAKLALENNTCSLTAFDQLTVCEFLQPSKLYRAEGYTLDFTCSLEGEQAKLGLFWNEEASMKRDLEKVWWLPITTNSEHTIRLNADATSNKAALSIDDVIVDTKEYIPVTQHGLYFVLENAKLILKHIFVTAH